MRNLILCILALTLAGSLAALTCREIQETTAANGNSPYTGASVTVEGIVVAETFYTGTNSNNRGFVIADEGGGEWSGLLIFTNQFNPQRGDKVQCTGTIAEYYNFTEMSPTSSVTIVSSGNAIPPATLITTADLSAANGEKWESVFVRVENVNVTATPNNYNEFKVNDGSGAAQVDDQCFPRSGFTWPGITNGQNWARIQGVVDFSFSEYGLNPRELLDLVQIDDVSNATVRVQTTNAEIHTLVNIPITTSRLKQEWGISSYHAKLRIDSDKVLFQGLANLGTLSALMPTFTVSADKDTIEISYVGEAYLTSAADGDTLIMLQLEPVSYGESMINILDFAYDQTNIQGTSDGKLMVSIREKIAWLNITNAKDGKNIFNPQLNEKITIEYGCKNSATGINAKALVRIYDVQGRLVATPISRNISNALGIEKFQWDGRDTSMKLLPIGVYYCHFEVIERSTGRKESTVQPIVIKSAMK